MPLRGHCVKDSFVNEFTGTRSMTTAERRSINDPSLTIDEFVSDEFFALLLNRVDVMRSEIGFIPSAERCISSYIAINNVQLDQVSLSMNAFFSFGGYGEPKYGILPVARWTIINDGDYRIRHNKRKFLLSYEQQDRLLSAVHDIKAMVNL